MLIKILSFLPLTTVITQISRLNRKLYIVSGDLGLLQQYQPKFDKQFKLQTTEKFVYRKTTKDHSIAQDAF